MNRAVSGERILYWAGIVVVAWAGFSFVLMPLVSALKIALLHDGSLSLYAPLADLAASRRVRDAFSNTVWMTLASMVTVTIVGVFQVAVLEYFKLRGRTFLKIAYATPLVFGGVVACAGYNFAYGPAGVVTTAIRWFAPSIRSDWFIGGFGVLFAHSFLLTGFYFLFLRAAMRRVDYATIEAARSMGASETIIFRRVVLPALRPTLLAVSLLTLHTALGSFAAPQVLGGRDFHMLSQMVLTLNSLRRSDLAALLALGMGAVLMLLILFAQHLEARGNYSAGTKSISPIMLKEIRNRMANTAIHVAAYLMALLYLLPVVLVVLFSFAPASDIGVEVFPSALTLKNYIRVFSGGSAVEPFLNSATMGAVSVGAALALTFFAIPVILRKQNWLTRLLDAGFFLPWVVPGILLAVGLITVFDHPNLLVGNAVLLGSYWLLPIGYAVILLPMTSRFLRASFVGIDPAYEEAARAMGASALYRFRRIIFPLIAPTAILVAGMGFNDLMAEYPLSAFLYNVNNKPLPIAIVDGAVSADPEQAAINLVYVTLITAFSLAVILFAERMSLGKEPQTNKL
ncbi:ABC transporter permease [Agrobacterium sp. NPDC089420]|uniref:ABC transporter permease n=1 Tax=Agrobacterium sp. NPDC089420 TaxID=3363918 RepID=UPI00384F2CFE